MDISNRYVAGLDFLAAQKAAPPQLSEPQEVVQTPEKAPAPTRLPFLSSLSNTARSSDAPLAQMNAAGDYEFGAFSISRSGPGFNLVIDSETGSTIDCTRGRSSGRPMAMLDEKLQSALFREAHRRDRIH